METGGEKNAVGAAATLSRSASDDRWTRKQRARARGE